MAPLLTVDEARAIVREALPERSTEVLPLAEATGLVLAADLTADRPFPPYDRAMMDGIACRSQDLDRPFTVHGLQAAGVPPLQSLPRRHCVEIMTGAVFPSCCDTLVPYEQITISEGVARITGNVSYPYQFVHQTGSDAPVGATILPIGTVLNAAAINLAVSAGHTSVEVYRRPRVAIVSTGDELVEPHKTPEPWQIRRSSPLALTAAVSSCHPACVTTHTLFDDLAPTIEGLREITSQHDITLITGGISKGKCDYIRPALEEVIGPPLFHGVAQRPGKPLAVWKNAETEAFVFALPGNPTSSLNCCTNYVLPSMRHLTGHPDARSPYQVSGPTVNDSDFTVFIPASISTGGSIMMHQGSNSGDELSPIHATGFMEVRPHSKPTRATFHPFT